MHIHFHISSICIVTGCYYISVLITLFLFDRFYSNSLCLQAAAILARALLLKYMFNVLLTKPHKPPQMPLDNDDIHVLVFLLVLEVLQIQALPGSRCWFRGRLVAISLYVCGP